MTQHYIQAFKQFSGASESDFLVKQEEWAVYFKWKDSTFVVRHYDDLREDYKHYFETRSYSEIYTQTNHTLWSHLLDEEVEISTADFIVGLYKAWREYWSDRKKEEFKDEAWKEHLRGRSWQDLQIFLEAYKLDPEQAIFYAANINEIELIPLIAVVVSEQFDDINEFLDVAMEYLIESGHELLAMEDTFEVVEVETPGRSNGTYLIYNDTLDYDFLVEDEEEQKQKKAAQTAKFQRKTSRKGTTKLR